jgi:hypothetical protein
VRRTLSLATHTHAFPSPFFPPPKTPYFSLAPPSFHHLDHLKCCSCLVVVLFWCAGLEDKAVDPFASLPDTAMMEEILRAVAKKEGYTKEEVRQDLEVLRLQRVYTVHTHCCYTVVTLLLHCCYTAAGAHRLPPACAERAGYQGARSPLRSEISN